MRSGAAAPGAFEYHIQEQHRHVAADAVALLGNARYGFNHGSPETRLKGIQLEDVWPCREVRIASACADNSLHLDVACRRVPCVLHGPANEVLGVFRDPGMIWRDVVGHEI